MILAAARSGSRPTRTTSRSRSSTPTTNTYEGFDTSTAEETVKRLSAKLGKEIKIDWQTPGWDMITAGSWGGRWDISIGSMSVTVGRAKVVDFTEPYYYDSGAVAVPKDSPVQSLSELDGGKTFCVGTATTYEQWLNGTLEIVDPNIVTAPTTPAGHGTADRQRVHPGGRRPGARSMRIVANANGLADAVARRQPIRMLDRSADLHRLGRVRARQERSRRQGAARRSSTRSSPRCTRTARSRRASPTEWLKKDVTTKPS